LEIAFNYLRVGGMSHIVEKLSMRVTTLLQTSPQLEVCIKNYGPPKLQESQFWEFQEFRNSQLWNPGKKLHLNVDLMANHRKYYKGEGGGFPQVWAVVNLMNLCVPVVRLCTKNALNMH
jgi:hypothetical protein